MQCYIGVLAQLVLAYNLKEGRKAKEYIQN